MLWGRYSQAGDILHPTASLSGILEGRLRLPGSCVRFTVHLIYLCVPASFTSLISAVTPVTLPCTPNPPPPAASHLNATNFSSVCRHCDQSPFHRTSHQTGMACSKAISYQAQNEILNQFMEPPPPNAPSPPRSPSLWPLLLLCTSSSSSSSAPCCRPSLLRHRVISLPLSAGTNPHPAPPPRSLSFFLPLSVRLWICPHLPPPPFFILPHPTRPVATAASLQFMGLLQQLPGRKKRQDLKNTMRRYGEEPCGEDEKI